MRVESGRPAAVIRLEGTFDLPAARLVEHSLRRMTAGDEVFIDFTRVRNFNDFGVAVLAQALKAADGVAPRLVGLRMHQVRLLRYFGIGPEAFRPEPQQGGDDDVVR